MDIPPEDNDLLAFLYGSKYRRQIVRFLANPLTPKMLATKTGLQLSHVSKTLSELTSMKLIKCVDPSVKKGKVYTTTALGDDVCAKYLKHCDSPSD